MTYSISLHVLNIFLAAEVLKMFYNTVHIPCIKQIQTYVYIYPTYAL